MDLVIKAPESDSIEITLIKDKKVFVKVIEKIDQQKTRNMLLYVEKVLKDKKIDVQKLKSVLVENQGQGFTTTRVRVTIANALAYALSIPIQGTSGKTLKKKGIQIVEPHYSQPPNITTKK